LECGGVAEFDRKEESLSLFFESIGERKLQSRFVRFGADSPGLWQGYEFVILLCASVGSMEFAAGDESGIEKQETK